MGKKILSVFIDESGDFGKYDAKAPNYYVALVFHDQSVDLTKAFIELENRFSNLGYPNHAVHVGPLIRREKIYENELMEKRKTLFNAIFHFARKVDIKYLCPRINKAECEENVLSYTAKLAKTIAEELRAHIDYFNDFDLLINYYDNGQSELTKIITSVFNTLFPNVDFRKVLPADYKLFQVADLICTMELTYDKAAKNAFSKSETEFFNSPKHFKKNIYKQIEKKKLGK